MQDRILLTLTLLDGKSGHALEGRTRLQKFLFLIQQRLEDRGESSEDYYNFVAYDYGPFSKEIYDDIESLIDRGLVAEEAKKLDDGVIKYDYRLTEKGETYIANSKEQLGSRLDIVSQVKEEFGDQTLQELIDYVYDEYPEYAKNSVLY